MSTSEQRLSANRANALLSTGPTSREGKVQASRNSLRHGLLSDRLLLADEDPEEFQGIVTDLCVSLKPLGLAEEALVERIAITIWRQRRLIRAETAAISLSREPVPTAQAASQELRRSYSSEVKPEHLQPFDAERETWCRAALAELNLLEVIDLPSLETLAPTVYDQLLTDAEGDPPEKFLAGHTGGVNGYIGELMRWCRKELRDAEARPHLLALADQVRTRASVLPVGTLEILSRYQTTLDNQLYKALRALREAQEWRLKTLECQASSAPQAEPIIEAA